MPVGDRLYSSCNWVPPIAHCPGARFADYLATMLRCLYVDAQHHARFAGATSYGWDLQDVSGDQTNSNRRIAAATTWVQVHRGRRTLGRETTHVRGLFLYAIPTSGLVTSNIRIRVIDASANEDNASSALELDLRNQIPINDAANRLNRNISRDENPFSGRVPPLLHEVAVPLSNVSTSTPGRCRILLEQYAVYTSSANGVGLQPLYASAWEEVRY